MTVHLIRYTAHGANGTETGIARVPSARARPSWAECHRAIPGYITGEYLCAEMPAPETPIGAS